MYVNDSVKNWLHKQTGKQKTCQETVRARVLTADTDKSKENTHKRKSPLRQQEKMRRGISQAPKSIPLEQNLVSTTTTSSHHMALMNNLSVPKPALPTACHRV